LEGIEMYGDYEVIAKDGLYWAKLDCNGHLACCEGTEEMLEETMQSLQTAYDNGFHDGGKDQKDRTKQLLGLD
jgi:hypothetical protein